MNKVLQLKSKFYIRADASAKIGLGHLVRCIALAQMLSKNFDITFVCSEIPEQLQIEIKALGFELQLINNELTFLESLCPHDLVILDSYSLNTTYQKEIKAKGAKLICIDDLHDKEFYADLIINHAPGVSKIDYQAQSYTRYALGPTYVLLRPSFLAHARETTIKENRKKVILICFGGLDFKNLTHLALNAAIEFSQFEKIIVVTGSSFSHYETIAALIDRDQRIRHFHAIDETKMLNLMGEADIVLIPSSGILLEALSVGTQIISGMYAENQRLLFERYKKSNAFISAENFTAEAVNAAIQKSLEQTEPPKKVFDGFSGKRLQTEVLSIVLNLRKATIADSKLLFDWVNDKDVRLNAIDKKTILWENHEIWYEKKLSSSEAHIFILELLGIAIGQVRYEQKEGYWVIDYSLDAAYRGRGFGKFLLSESLTYFSGEKIKAYVLPQNIASSHVFKALHFMEAQDEKVTDVRCKIYKLYL